MKKLILNLKSNALNILGLLFMVVCFTNVTNAQAYNPYNPVWGNNNYYNSNGYFYCNKNKHNRNYNNNYYNNNYNYSYSSLIPTTSQASDIYQSNATLNGYVTYSNTGYNQQPGLAWFEYGTSYYNFSNTSNKTSIYQSTSINSYLTGLACGQTYFYRAVTSSTNGVQYGQTLSFTTSPCYNYYQNNTPYYPYSNYGWGY